MLQDMIIAQIVGIITSLGFYRQCISLHYFTIPAYCVKATVCSIRYLGCQKLGFVG